MIDLKLCPFCGGTGRLTRNNVMVRGVSRRAAWVYCLDCNIKTGYFFRDEDEHYCQHAAEAWNRRPLQKPLTLEELELDTYAWIEFKDDNVIIPIQICEPLFTNGVISYYTCEYGKNRFSVNKSECGSYWRCWVSKPTDEERSAAAWEN